MCDQLMAYWQHLETAEIIWKHLWNTWKHLTSSWEKMSAEGVVINKSYNPAENVGKQLRTSKIMGYHPENNWRLLIDNWVQFEEDFNSRTKNSWEHRKTAANSRKHLISYDIILRTTEDPFSSVWRGFQQSDRKVSVRWGPVVISDQTNS